MLGLTTYLQQAQSGIWDVHATFLPAIYTDGVNLAGGTAVLLPPQPDSPDRVLDGLDGLIITGGRDLDPAGYGQQRHPETDEPVPANQQRDAWEIALVRGAIRRGMPVLGICRGAQVINVALGGTLFQDIPTQCPGKLEHRNAEKYEHCFHDVRILPNTWLSRLYPDIVTRRVNTIHHQAIDALGEGLVVEALSEPDGVVEAVRWEGHCFVVGVQWHPEFLKPDDATVLATRPLLDAFLEACTDRKMTGRAKPMVKAA